LRALAAECESGSGGASKPSSACVEVHNLADEEEECEEEKEALVNSQTLLEYSQSQVTCANAGAVGLSQDKKRGRKRKLLHQGEAGGVLLSPSVSRGKAIHGKWCVVWSDVMKRLFFYNIHTETGQLDVPDELVSVYGSTGKDGPAIAELRANMSVPSDENYHPVECTLRESQGYGDEAVDGMGLDLTGSQSEGCLTQYEGLRRAASRDSSSSPGLSSSQQDGEAEQEQRKTLFIVDDSPYNSMDESQSSTDHLLRLSAGRRVSSSYDIATAVMRRMETTVGRAADDDDDHDDVAKEEGVFVTAGRSGGETEESQDGIVACQQCTFHNPVGNTRCDMCEAKLPVQVKYVSSRKQAESSNINNKLSGF
jgi:hypothetical protein